MTATSPSSSDNDGDAANGDQAAHVIVGAAHCIGRARISSSYTNDGDRGAVQTQQNSWVAEDNGKEAEDKRPASRVSTFYSLATLQFTGAALAAFGHRRSGRGDGDSGGNWVVGDGGRKDGEETRTE